MNAQTHIKTFKTGFYIKSAGSNSYHVMQRGRRNEFGEPWCEAPYLSYDEAVKLCQELNKAS